MKAVDCFDCRMLERMAEADEAKRARVAALASLHTIRTRQHDVRQTAKEQYLEKARKWAWLDGASHGASSLNACHYGKQHAYGEWVPTPPIVWSTPKPPETPSLKDSAHLHPWRHVFKIYEQNAEDLGWSAGMNSENM